MTGEHDWRIGVDARDYFGAQRKQLQVADRRPVIRNAADLVGPGIAALANRVLDFDNPLARFNGYFATDGALNGPPLGTRFVGQVVVDETLGGIQMFTDLDSGEDWRRAFTRAPADVDSITWHPWVRVHDAVAHAQRLVASPTSVLGSGALTTLDMPTLTLTGPVNTFLRSAYSITILRPGVYSGYLSVSGNSAGASLVATLLHHPAEAPLGVDVQTGQPGGAPALTIPFSFATPNEGEVMYVQISQDSGAPRDFTISQLQLSRLGNYS